MRACTAAVMFVVIAGGVASAGPGDGADAARLLELRTAAETAEREAKASGDRETYDRCGEGYLALAAAAGAAADPQDAAEVHYNAAVCFEEGGSYGQAMALQERVIELAPASRVAAKALARGAMMRSRIGDYAGAADGLEEYARKYAGEQDASDALSDAAYYRRALGDEPALRRVLEYWLKKFGAKQPRVAAEVAHQLVRSQAAGKKPAAAAALHRAWLGRFGGKADRLLTARVLLTIGQLELEASCPVKLVDGLCLARARLPRGAERCRPDLAPMVAVPRTPAAVTRAAAALRQTVALAEAVRNPDSPGEAAWIVGQAQLARTTPALEAALANQPPVPVFDAKGAWTRSSREAFQRWLADRTLALSRAELALDAAYRSQHAGVRAQALGRIAWVMIATADQLAAASLLRHRARDAWTREDYCRAMSAHTEDLMGRALEAADRCLDLAADAGVVDDAAPCQHVFDRLDPARPRATERIPAAATLSFSSLLR